MHVPDPDQNTEALTISEYLARVLEEDIEGEFDASQDAAEAAHRVSFFANELKREYMHSKPLVEEDDIIEEQEQSVEATTTEGDTADSYVGTCSESISSADKTSEPTASEVLYDVLAHHELYDHDDDSTYSASNLSQNDFFTTGAEQKIHPFEPKWNFGFNLNVPPLNLSNNTKTEVFLIGSHKGIIFDYGAFTMRYFYGHYNKIVSSGVEQCGRWVVTSDLGEKSSIIVTDARNCKTIYTIQNKRDDDGAVLVAISPSGRYLVSVHRPEHPIIKFWLWSFGLNHPDDSYMSNEKRSFGKPKKICFHPNDENYIMVAFEKQILFIYWDESTSKLSIRAPAHRHGRHFTDCAMALNCHECFVSTMEGYIQVYSSTTYTEHFDEHPVDNNSSFIKEIKISSHAISSVQSIDGILATVDARGSIEFYDIYVKLLYWVENMPDVPTIKTLSFTLTPRQNKLADPFVVNNDFFSTVDEGAFLELPVEDRVEAYKTLQRNSVPSIASLQRHPFVTRNCIVACKNGCVYQVDFVNRTHKKLADIMDSPIASIDTCDERPFLAVAYENGRITLYDYNKLSVIVSKPKCIHSQNEHCNSTIKFTSQSLLLSVGSTNGDLWFLNLILKPIHSHPYSYSDKPILKIVHSHDSVYCAFYDNTGAVFLLTHEELVWRLIGKIRSHCKPIKDMMFTNTKPPKLFSIGADRYLVEYNLDPFADELSLKSRVCIEQSAIPTCFLYYPTAPNTDTYLLVCNSQQKYKMIREEDRMCRSITLGPSYGCYAERPVEKMVVLPECNGKYLAFSNGMVIGIQKLPLDGNPYKCIGVNGTPNLSGFVVSNNGQYLFTSSHCTYAVFMWDIKTIAVDYLQRCGGLELSPYYCLLEGGENGWFFKEMMDLFCYMQILHQEDSYQPQNFAAKLSISELPDLLRSCGYYPSNYEVEDVLNDIKYRDYEKTGKMRDKINFLEFVKLYINHRPPHGITTDELKTRFAQLFSNSTHWKNEEVSRNGFLEYLCSYGEPFDTSSIGKCLAVLMKQRPEDSDCSDLGTNLPSKIDIDVLTENILGILHDSLYEEMQQRSTTRDSKE